MRRRIGEKINQKKGKIYWKNRNSRPKRRGGIGRSRGNSGGARGLGVKINFGGEGEF
jgi:hypothetical protein